MPNTFQAGTPAEAGQVNANFQALVDAVNAQQAAIDQLQTDLGAAEAEIDQLQTDLNAAEMTIGQFVNDASIAVAAILELQDDVDCLPGSSIANPGNSVLALDDFLFLDTDANGFDTARFDAINVQVTNGLGATNGSPGGNTASGGPTNGLGNVIIGYNETHPDTPAVCNNGSFDNQADCEAVTGTWAAGQKTGSHNLVIGVGHNYTRHGGFVAGFANTVNQIWSSASGGTQNIARGIYTASPAASRTRRSFEGRVWRTIQVFR